VLEDGAYGVQSTRADVAEADTERRQYQVRPAVGFWPPLGPVTSCNSRVTKDDVARPVIAFHASRAATTRAPEPKRGPTSAVDAMR
jgi:hypothetical protein